MENIKGVEITVCDGCGAEFRVNGDHYCDACNDDCDNEFQRWADAHEGSPEGGRYF